MTAITALLTTKAYGYPARGARRRRKPTILACLHQTSNAIATAIGERTYANRVGSAGPSATAYIDRDGTIVRAIDPVAYAAWSQGDVASPNLKIPTVAAAIASGVNMNEWVHESIECSGAGPEPYTDAQFESVAQLIAAASRALGLPINRSTVVVHADINSVSRRSDPWPPATREARVKRVIDRANAILTPTVVTVTVKSGDTLSAIASAHSLTLAVLLAYPENAKYRASPGLIHLSATWKEADVPEAKAELLHAVYERIVVTGRTIVSIRLTPSAHAHGLALALPDKVAMARPTGVGRAITTYDMPIEARDEWLAAAARHLA